MIFGFALEIPSQTKKNIINDTISAGNSCFATDTKEAEASPGSL